MIDSDLLADAARARLTTVQVAAVTGSPQLAATATGYTRDTGSFVTDGFLIGQEIQPGSFGSNTPQLLIGVSALTLTTFGVPAIEAAAPGRTIVSGLPSIRFYEDEIKYDASGNIIGRKPKLWYLTEEFTTGGSGMVTTNARGGVMSEDFLYTPTLYAPIGYGPDAMRRLVDAIKKKFTLGTPLSIEVGNRAMVPLNQGPRAGGPLDAPGWTARQINIPLQARSANVILP